MTRLARFALACALAVAATPANAGLYWFQGVHDASISLCFVGNALTARPARVQEILADVHEFELAANIRFDYLGTCPPAVPLFGKDYFGGDIRVVIPGINVSGTGMVPGNGCPMFGGAAAYDGGNDGWGSWSNAPDDLIANASCMYNLKLGDDPWNADPYINHTLHEFGHNMGLSHEHARDDNTCNQPGTGGTSAGYLTPYDRDSVMHYQFLACSIDGNYGYSGFSYYDRLSLRMMYPMPGTAAQIIGKRVLRTNEIASYRLLWDRDGAHMPFVVPSLTWRADGVPLSAVPLLATGFPTTGDHTVSVALTDFLGRAHAGSVPVRVLGAAEINGLMGVLEANTAMLLSVVQDAVFANGFE